LDQTAPDGSPAGLVGKPLKVSVGAVSLPVSVPPAIGSTGVQATVAPPRPYNAPSFGASGNGLPAMP
jgi:hypothetical protein